MLLLIDQASKCLVRSNIPLGESRFIAKPVLGSILELKHAKNTGIAFSMFDNYPMLLTILVTVIMLILFVYLLKTSEPNYFWAFVLGGGLSNLLDRYLFGEVTDYINFLFVDFAVFNLADAFLNIGMFLMILFLFAKESSKKA